MAGRLGGLAQVFRQFALRRSRPVVGGVGIRLGAGIESVPGVFAEQVARLAWL